MTKKKIRRLELTAGAQRGKVNPGVWAANTAMGEAERDLARQAEAAYRRIVADWQAKKGAGRPGTAFVKSLFKEQAARQGISPRTCALARGRPRPGALLQGGTKKSKPP